MNDGMLLGLKYYLLSNDSAALRPNPNGTSDFQLSTVNETFFFNSTIDTFNLVQKSCGFLFSSPVIVEIPHFGSMRGKERELIVLRSENGETWKEHQFDSKNEDLTELLNGMDEGNDAPRVCGRGQAECRGLCRVSDVLLEHSLMQNPGPCTCTAVFHAYAPSTSTVQMDKRPHCSVVFFDQIHQSFQDPRRLFFFFQLKE